jgi:hypothetical protein
MSSYQESKGNLSEVKALTSLDGVPYEYPEAFPHRGLGFYGCRSNFRPKHATKEYDGAVAGPYHWFTLACRHSAQQQPLPEPDWPGRSAGRFG